jgi:hypothetical protein
LGFFSSQTLGRAPNMLLLSVAAAAAYVAAAAAYVAAYVAAAAAYCCCCCCCCRRRRRRRCCGDGGGCCVLQVVAQCGASSAIFDTGIAVVFSFMNRKPVSAFKGYNFTDVSDYKELKFSILNF